MKTRWWIAALALAALGGWLAGHSWRPQPADIGTPAPALAAKPAPPPLAMKSVPAPPAPPAATPPPPTMPAAAAPAAPPPPDYSRAEQEIIRIKAEQAAALEREGERLDERMARTTDPNELAILVKLEEKMAALDAVQQKMERAASAEERLALTPEIQPLIGEVMQLNQADRQYRMTELARTLGLTDGADVNRLMQETETSYRETQRDLSSFLSRGGPFLPSAPEPFRTTPPPSPYPHP